MRRVREDVINFSLLNSHPALVSGLGAHSTLLKKHYKGALSANSGVNELVSSLDTDAPDTLEAALSIASLFEKLIAVTELNVFAVDFRHACKNTPRATDQSDYATSLLAPPAGPPMKATLRTHPRGSKRARQLGACYGLPAMGTGQVL